MAFPNVSALRQLADVISASITNIEKTCQESNIDYPGLDGPFNPASPGEGLAMRPDMIQNATLVVAACGQLSSAVNVPAFTLLSTVGSFHVSSSMRTAIDANIVEILRENSQGLHVNDISKESGMEPDKIARILRLLASNHIFVEIAPDVFKNNRLSSMMDTLKSVKEIKADPLNKHVGTPGFSALVSHSGDEVLKASAYMPEVLLNPSGDEKIPLQLAFNTNKNLFEWFEDPGNEGRLKRFGAAMQGASNGDPADAILRGFQWSSLSANSVVVDVGGGIGNLTMKIFEANPGLKYIVQDRPQVIAQGLDHWNQQAPSTIKEGIVRFEAIDFFADQPVKDATVFLCRMIMHDYEYARAKTILSILRGAARKETKLLIVDQIVPYACVDTKTPKNIKGYNPLPVPLPLLPNLGKAASLAYLADLQMLVNTGGEERTLGTFVELLSSAGWNIVETFNIPGSLHGQILAVPV